MLKKYSRDSLIEHIDQKRCDLFAGRISDRTAADYALFMCSLILMEMPVRPNPKPPAKRKAKAVRK